MSVQEAVLDYLRQIPTDVANVTVERRNDETVVTLRPLTQAASPVTFWFTAGTDYCDIGMGRAVTFSDYKCSPVEAVAICQAIKQGALTERLRLIGRRPVESQAALQLPGRTLHAHMISPLLWLWKLLRMTSIEEIHYGPYEVE